MRSAQNTLVLLCNDPTHMFKAPRFQDLSLSDWLAHTPPELVMAHLNLDKETLAHLPKDKSPIVPA